MPSNEDIKVAGSPEQSVRSIPDVAQQLQDTQAMPAVDGPDLNAADVPLPGMPSDSGIQLPSVDELKAKVLAGEVPPAPPTGPQYVPGHLDIAAFIRAQHTFLEVQTWFFTNNHNGHYSEALVAYSKAQTAYILALSEVVKTLGVV